MSFDPVGRVKAEPGEPCLTLLRSDAAGGEVNLVLIGLWKDLLLTLEWRLLLKSRRTLHGRG